MNANRYVLRPATIGPCSASPVHLSLRASAWNRPNAFGAIPWGRVVSSNRAKWRCNVRADGHGPPWVDRICAMCAAVRAGFSRFNAAASSRTSVGVLGTAPRGEGTSASNPPVRQARIHRSNVTRDTRTGVPNGPTWSVSANARTITPRSR